MKQILRITTATMFGISLLLAGWLMEGCCAVKVHAASGLPLPPDTGSRSFTHDMATSPLPCSPETFSAGSADPNASAESMVLETQDTLEFSAIVCPLVKLASSTYTTRYEHTIQQMQFEEGSNTGSIQEYAAWAFFEWDDTSGHHVFVVSQQRDQHVDDHNYETQRSLAKTFPAGTVITLIRPAMHPAFCTNRAELLNKGNDCETGEQISLF